MANPQQLWFGLFLTAILLANTTAKKIRLPLIHDASSSSPSFHKPNSPSFDHQQNGAAAVAPLWPDDVYRTVFLVEFMIGEPPSLQRLVMDTGSDLIWVCNACGSGYEPNSSSTFKAVACYDDADSAGACSDNYKESKCNWYRCVYQVVYGDGSYSNGIIAHEKFTFNTSDDGLVQLPNITFGTGQDNKWHGGLTQNGIFGISPFGKYSLLASVGKFFSYCIGNITNSLITSNQLVLGDGAILQGPSTPITISDTYYLVSLESISIGDQELEIHHHHPSDKSTVMDSGSTATHLTQGMYDALQPELMKLIAGYRLWSYPVARGGLPCYWGNLYTDLPGFPPVTLKFANGAQLVLGVDGFFKQQGLYFCLLLQLSDREDLNVVGVYAQQYHSIGYDFNSMTATIVNIDCSLLDD